MKFHFIKFFHSRPIYDSHIPPWAYPNGFVGLNVKLEHMTRVYYSELLVKNALKAEKIKISVLIPLSYYWELHIQISERFRALLDLKVGVRIGVTFPTVTLAIACLLLGIFIFSCCSWPGTSAALPVKSQISWDHYMSSWALNGIFVYFVLIKTNNNFCQAFSSLTAVVKVCQKV